ncbi:1,4-alpha-glucan branching protein [Streptomyces sp. NPDC047017]|uniref:maltokinase N-terminal cap-like domain-containing protein n=1 Tax=Streptomyces sp. NPDC047017 TaxID=3155024 RepID=UPI0033DB453C
MAVIHRTTIHPTKLELLTAWLPSRPWYGGDGAPLLEKAGGFRLDDPEGEVGIEFLVVNDIASGAAPVTYLAPLTYRGAPLDGAEHALVGTMEHGVLGRRWVYDGCHDPVFTAQLPALIEGRVPAQAQSTSDTEDKDVARSCTGTGPVPTRFAPATDSADATDLSAADGTTLRVHRVLRPTAPDGSPLPPTASAGAAAATGQVTAVWNLPDGTPARGLFCVLHDAAPRA